MKKPIIVMGIDPGTKSIGIAMCEVTDYGIRLLSPPKQVLFSGPLRNGHGTVVVSRRNKTKAECWDEVNAMVKKTIESLGVPEHLVSAGPRLDIFALANKARRLTIEEEK